jgi:hypothetical protein
METAGRLLVRYWNSADFGDLMTPAYMPFTYLSASTAHLLNALVGPVVIYQPLARGISGNLSALASQGLVEIRTPVTKDDDRLRAALAEFTQWARMNPGKSTAGAGFIGARQGQVPFYDETTINRIRSEIRRYQTPERGMDSDDAAFSARLFLAAAQENDLASDRLDHDLKQFEMLERGFLDSLTGADEAGFARKAPHMEIWPEDQGSKLTEQRIRAWAMLAAADEKQPQLLVTTSSAVMDALVETFDGPFTVERQAEIRLALPSPGAPEMLGAVLADLAVHENLSPADLAPFAALAARSPVRASVHITLFSVANQNPTSFIRQMVPTPLPQQGQINPAESVRNTLIVLIQSG